MRIAVVAPTEIPARRANTIQVLKMTQALTLLGHQTRLVSPFNPKSFRQPGRGKSGQIGTQPCEWKTLAYHYGLQQSFTVEWVPASPSLRSYDYSLRSILWAKKWRADLLYTRLPQTAALASMINMPTILEIHDIPQGRMGPFLFQLFLKGKGGQKLVVITQALANDLYRAFNIPTSASFTIIAPDGVDLGRYQNLPSPSKSRQLISSKMSGKDGTKLISASFMAGYTGHLYPGRGTNFLLELAKESPGILFLIAGGEPEEVEALNARIIKQDIQNIILTGFIPNAELPLYQAACDILLMPYQEHIAGSSGGDIAKYLSPMKLFEYLAAGRPIISSDLPVLREILNSQNAILLPLHEQKNWTRVIEKLKTDIIFQEKLAKQARQDAQKYSWEKRASHILEDYTL